MAAVDTPVRAARLSPGRKAKQKGVVGETEERMNAAELAAKKMLLPFINELSFIEIALAAVSGSWLVSDLVSGFSNVKVPSPFAFFCGVLPEFQLCQATR